MGAGKKESSLNGAGGGPQQTDQTHWTGSHCIGFGALHAVCAGLRAHAEAQRRTTRTDAFNSIAKRWLAYFDTYCCLLAHARTRATANGQPMGRRRLAKQQFQTEHLSLGAQWANTIELWPKCVAHTIGAPLAHRSPARPRHTTATRQPAQLRLGLLCGPLSAGPLGLGLLFASRWNDQREASRQAKKYVPWLHV